MKNKLIIKYTQLDNSNIEVIYSDNTKEIISINKFNKFIKSGKLKMGFPLCK